MSHKRQTRNDRIDFTPDVGKIGSFRRIGCSHPVNPRTKPAVIIGAGMDQPIEGIGDHPFTDNHHSYRTDACSFAVRSFKIDGSKIFHATKIEKKRGPAKQAPFSHIAPRELFSNNLRRLHLFSAASGSRIALIALLSALFALLSTASGGLSRRSGSFSLGSSSRFLCITTAANHRNGGQNNNKRQNFFHRFNRLKLDIYRTPQRYGFAMNMQ